MSEPIHEDDGASPERVARLGEELRAARIAHSMEVTDVAQRLNLELYVVEGLEQDDYERLPEPAYIRGYLLAYLRLMDLPLSMLESFDNQYPMDGPLATSPGLSSQSACSRDGWVRCISTGLVVLLILVVGLWVLEESFNILDTGVEPVVVEQAGDPETLPEAEPEAEPTTESEPDIVSLPLETDENMAIDEQVLATEDVDTTESSDLPVDVDTPSVATETTGTEENTAVVAEPEQEIVEETALSTLPRLDMKFLGTSWIRIDDSAGSKLKAGTFNSGENISIEHEGELRLIIGRSQNVELNYAGEPVDLSEFKSGVARLVLGKSSE